MKTEDVEVGKVYGCVKVISDPYKYGKQNRLYVDVECVHCGLKKRIYSSSLDNEKYTSCKCKLVTHGMNKTKIYSVYANIKYRCYNSNHHEFKNYGGKGIVMCDEWLGENGFSNFYNWALENGYKEGLTIDRIDSDKNYEPNNCQWITRSENTAKSNKICQHRRANNGMYYAISEDGKYIEFENASKFAREHNLNAGTVRYFANSKTKNKYHKGWIIGFVKDITDDIKKLIKEID